MENISTPKFPHNLAIEAVYTALESSIHGLPSVEIENRRELFGSNEFPQGKADSLLSIFLRQFKSPLIYVLLIAALMSIIIQEWADALFIFLVLLVNAIIGTVQEYSAEKSSLALRNMVETHCRVIRDGESFLINARELVPGDIVLLESGDKVPADLRIINQHELKVDESLLTGESVAVAKNAAQLLEEMTVVADRLNMLFTGTMVEKGRARGIVVNTGLSTELGRIARDVIQRVAAKAPLVIRMDLFTRRIAYVIIVTVIIFGFVALKEGVPISEVFLMAVALAVSAIPEGLPVALTVALAVGMHRMAKRNVIVRKLVAVESLGSCTYIATDKTGTLTVNQLTVKKIQFPCEALWDVSGRGYDPVGTVETDRGAPVTAEESMLYRLYHAAILPNEGFLGLQGDQWVHHGDAVDVALLVLARKAGLARDELESSYTEISSIPFEPENLFAASLNQADGVTHAYVKGAVEKVIGMCSHMISVNGEILLDEDKIRAQATTLASDGYRVLAFASGQVQVGEDYAFNAACLNKLTFLGLVGMIDPLRDEAKAAIAACRRAGVKVSMVTGDNPVTALSIARELELASGPDEVVSGPSMKAAGSQSELDNTIYNAAVFARVEPHQKLQIVDSLQRQHHFVAVSGDGANDAPALKAANVGVAMGKNGTDIARETADIVLTDDNFASIVAGIEEGRIAYANVRKVIFLLISTGAAEIILFLLALITQLPLPLLAVQLLWLNLVTNGIQDVALAFEPAEGNELRKPPRAPGESIFNRIMIERVVLSALVMGVVAFLLFDYLLTQGFSVDEARNGTLLLMVLFENIHVFNSRSETMSALVHNPLRNRLLLFGTLIAQMIHIGAMYTPGISDVLAIQPVSFSQWLTLLMLAFSVLIVMELHKWFVRKFYHH